MGDIFTSDDIEYFVMFSFITACLCVCCCCCPSRSEDEDDENVEVETGTISQQTNTQILADRHSDIEIWSTGLEYRNEAQGKKDEENLAPLSYDEAIQS